MPWPIHPSLLNLQLWHEIATNLLPHQSPATRWLEIALILLVFFVEGGAPVPHNNEAHYLAKAKHYWNPAWCEGDLFLESADPHLVFYWTVGLLTKWFSLPTVAWFGRIAAWSSLAWAWQRLELADRARKISVGGHGDAVGHTHRLGKLCRGVGSRWRRGQMFCLCIRLLGSNGNRQRELATRLASLRCRLGVACFGRGLVGCCCADCLGIGREAVSTNFWCHASLLITWRSRWRSSVSCRD